MNRRLLLSYLTITALVLLILEVPLGISYARREEDRLLSDLERDARVLATVVEDELEGRNGPDPQTVVDDYARRTDGRVVVVNPDGVSVADSDRPGEQRDFSTRPEIADALSGETASGTRHSDTLGSDLVYVSVPVASGGRVLGAVRVTYPRSQLDDRIRRNWIALAGLAGVVLLTVVVVGTVLARSVTRPMRELARAAESLSSGNLRARAPETEGPPELRALAREFNVMAGRLEQLVVVQREFVADASHELRAPLTALRLRLENLEASTQPGGADLDAAITEVARLSDLVDALLRLARAESSEQVRESVDLCAEVEARLDAWAPVAEEHEVGLVSRAPATCVVSASRGAIPQILDNLLSNALEVAPRGSRVTVEVRDDHADMVAMIVTDEGPGLSADDRARAFDRFWRAPNAHAGGSGIGLSIVAQLVANSGGAARLDAGPDGRGVAAVVQLPRG